MRIPQRSNEEYRNGDMPLSLTVALSVVAMLTIIAIPAIMLVTAGVIGSFGLWGSWFTGWLVVVFGWVTLQFHLDSLDPDYFGPGVWDDYTGWTASISLILLVSSFVRTALNN